MQRTIVGSIYGYLICLIAVLVFIRSGAGLTASIVGMAAPATAGVSVRAMPPLGDGGGIMGPRTRGGDFYFRTGGGMEFGRMAAIRGFFVSLVLLIIAIGLFRWHWRWLHSVGPSTA